MSASQIRSSPTSPKSWYTKGAGGHGWCGGAALGIKLAVDLQENESSKFVTMVCGDGCFLFSVLSSVYGVSARYTLPTLTVILNNGGWAAPRVSARAVDPSRPAITSASLEELNLSFGPEPP